MQTTSPPQKQYTILIARPQGFGSEATELGSWLVRTAFTLGRDPAVKDIANMHTKSARILHNRNMIAQEALDSGIDYVLMVDPDMQPDMYLGKEEGALPFVQSSFHFLLHEMHGEPAVVGAPACGGAPERMPCIWIKDSKTGYSRQMTREEAADAEPCFELVDAIGSGLLLLPTEVFRRLEPPFFDDEYSDPQKTKLWTSQDVYFSNKCTAAGIPIVVNFHSWAGHLKTECVGRPVLEPLPVTPKLAACG